MPKKTLSKKSKSTTRKTKLTQVTKKHEPIITELLHNQFPEVLTNIIKQHMGEFKKNFVNYKNGQYVKISLSEDTINEFPDDIKYDNSIAKIIYQDKVNINDIEEKRYGVLIYHDSLPLNNSLQLLFFYNYDLEKLPDHYNKIIDKLKQGDLHSKSKFKSLYKMYQTMEKYYKYFLNSNKSSDDFNNIFESFYNNPSITFR